MSCTACSKSNGLFSCRNHQGRGTQGLINSSRHLIWKMKLSCKNSLISTSLLSSSSQKCALWTPLFSGLPAESPSIFPLDFCPRPLGLHWGDSSLLSRASEAPMLRGPESQPCTALSAPGAPREECPVSGGFTRACVRSVPWLQAAVQGLSSSSAVCNSRISALAVFVPQHHGRALQKLLCIGLKAPIARRAVKVPGDPKFRCQIFSIAQKFILLPSTAVRFPVDHLLNSCVCV